MTGVQTCALPICKVYQVKISADDISKSDSFSNTQIQRVIVNSKGKQFTSIILQQNSRE